MKLIESMNEDNNGNLEVIPTTENKDIDRIQWYTIQGLVKIDQ